MKTLSSSGSDIQSSLKAAKTCLQVSHNTANQIFGGIKALTIYLAVILSLALVCTTIYTVKVLPQFDAMFDSMGAELPLFTQTVLGISEFLTLWWWLLFPLVFFMIYQLFKLGNNIAALEPTGMSLRFIPGGYKLTRLHFKYLLVNYTYILITGGMKSREAFYSALKLIEDKPTDESLKNVQKNGFMEDICVAEELDTLGPEIEHAFHNVEHEYMDVLGKIREKVMLTLQITVAAVVGAIVVAMYLPIFQMGHVV